MSNDLFHKIQLRLIEEEKLPVAYAAFMTAEALNGFAPELRKAVLRWAEGQSVADASLEGTTVKDIRAEAGGSEFQALCLLNHTVRYPGCFEDAVLNLEDDFTGQVDLADFEGCADELDEDGEEE